MVNSPCNKLHSEKNNIRIYIHQGISYVIFYIVLTSMPQCQYERTFSWVWIFLADRAIGPVLCFQKDTEGVFK